MVEKEEVIIYSETDRVSCMGEMNDHPKVYYTIPKGGQVVCGYCDIIFKLKEEEDDIWVLVLYFHCNDCFNISDSS